MASFQLLTHALPDDRTGDKHSNLCCKRCLREAVGASAALLGDLDCARTHVSTLSISASVTGTGTVEKPIAAVKRVTWIARASVT